MTERRDRRHSGGPRVGLALAMLCLAVALGPRPASAQSSAPVALDKTQVMTCLCQDRSMATLRQEIDVLANMRVARERELEPVDREVVYEQEVSDPNNPVEQENLRRLLERQQQLRNLREDVRATELDAVAKLKAIVNSYNDNCAGQRMLKILVAEIEDELETNPDACEAVQ